MTPSEDAERILADIEYLERMYIETCQGANVLAQAALQRASLLAQSNPYRGVAASLAQASLTVCKQSSDFAVSILSAKQTLRAYIEKLQK